ncbi:MULTISPECIES: helix-turn-helix transcriptional regulator [Streptomyces]|uniref:helix-turn-helix transcriptional regulator n=1 Tax=Streptomyces lycopersici TaxID=2974589 RepID=UPI00352410F6
MPPDDLPPWIQQHRWAAGQRLRVLRLGKGLTQMQLGARAEIDNKTISRIENGRYPDVDRPDRPPGPRPWCPLLQAVPRL